MIAPCRSKGGMAMRFRTSVVFFCVAPWLLALAASSDQKDAAVADEPHYDIGTNVDVVVVVTDVKNVDDSNSPMAGTHLIVRPESARAGGETTDVYLAPLDFLKDFGCHFVKGDRIQVKGSKVKFNGNNVVLAREVRLESNTVYLRDEHGVPYWKKS